VQSGFENSPETQPGETGVYRRADVEGFADWARTTIDRLERELAGLKNRLAGAEQHAAVAEQRAADAEQALASRLTLEGILGRAADHAAEMAAKSAAEAAAEAAVERVEALLASVREKARSERRPEHTTSAFDPEPDEPATTYDDPIRDPLPRWDERLLAFPDEQVELPPIGPIFGADKEVGA